MGPQKPLGFIHDRVCVPESSYTDYTSDLSEMELRAFIAATLHKNARDRAMILELEQLFTDFLNDFGCV